MLQLWLTPAVGLTMVWLHDRQQVLSEGSAQQGPAGASTGARWMQVSQILVAVPVDEQLHANRLSGEGTWLLGSVMKVLEQCLEGLAHVHHEVVEVSDTARQQKLCKIHSHEHSSRVPTVSGPSNQALSDACILLFVLQQHRSTLQFAFMSASPDMCHLLQCMRFHRTPLVARFACSTRLQTQSQALKCHRSGTSTCTPSETSP